MALPLKSGADLYNQQLIRAAVWNYSADGLEPSEYATGLIYFNTNPNSNMFQKLRFRTATDWKTIAFAEDLDVATNKDFQALKEKVELLSGEVDTDAIISNMKEVTAFLEGFAEDANLMEALNKKLDKTGGTITGNLQIGAADNESFNWLMLVRSGKAFRFNCHSTAAAMDFGSYTNGTFVSLHSLSLSDYGFAYKAGDNTYTVLHSGNVGEYNAGSATKLQTKRKLWGNDFDGTADVSGTLIIPHGNGICIRDTSSSAKYIASVDGYNTLVLGRDFNAEGYSSKVVGYNVYLSYGASRTTGLTLNSSGNVTIGATDKASSHKLWVDGNTNVTGNISTSGNIIINNEKHYQAIDSNGQSKNILYLSSANNLWLGYDTSSAGYNTMVAGNIVNLRYGQNRDFGLILNASGNVTIGGADKAEGNYKLWVHGNTYVNGTLDVNGSIYLPNASVLAIKDASGTNAQILTYSSSNELHLGYGNRDKGNTSIWGKELQFKANSTNALIINSSGVASFASRVLIGNGVVDDGLNSLQVGGSICTNYALYTGGKKAYNDAVKGAFIGSDGTIHLAAASAPAIYFHYGLSDSHTSYMYGTSNGMQIGDVVNVTKRLNINGATDDENYALNVKGRIKSSQDIIAEGTVACKGVAAVGDIAGMGTVDKWIGMVDKTTNSQVYTHGLNTEDVTVSIYEKNGSEWVLVLTDVDIVDQNRIRVMFGTTPTIDHKIVVMG